MSDGFGDDFALEAVDFQTRLVLRLDLLVAKLDPKLFTH